MSTITYAREPVDKSNGRYVLNEAGEPVPCVDLFEWAAWIEKDENLQIAYTTLPDGRIVSTVFLGLDHRHGREGPPLLFETAIFSAAWKLIEIGERYASRHDALVGHEKLCEELRQNTPPS